MAASTVAALIAAVASLAGALLAWALKQRSDRKLAEFQLHMNKELSDRKIEGDLKLANLQEALRSEGATRLTKLEDALAEARSGRDAQRDYEYDARKRLYGEIQPLLFQLVEHSDSAYRRIANIAHSARQGYLAPDTSWLYAGETYYFPTTIFRLFAPTVTFRLIQRRLTIVDLSLDSDIRALYNIAKQMYHSWNAAWDLADTEPSIGYDPYNGESRGKSSQVWEWQHVLIGQLDQVIDSMIIGEGRDSRCITYGQFFKDYSNQGSTLFSQIQEPVTVFDRFHPVQRPVLWRILLAQAHFHRALLNSFESAPGQILHPADAIPKSQRYKFALTQAEYAYERERRDDPDDRVDDAHGLAGSFSAVQAYLRATVHLPPRTAAGRTS